MIEHIGDTDTEPAVTQEEILTGLNPEQLTAVTHDLGALLILAGPGSGKTRVICHRIAWLISTGRAKAGQVLAVTFTNKAAEEMQTRLAALLKAQRTGLRVCTFHALCARFLRIDGERIGIPEHFVIYDRDDQLKAAKQAINKLNLPDDDDATTAKSLISQISKWKTNFMTPAERLSMNNNYREQKVAEAFREYERVLSNANALDFDDLLLNGMRLLNDCDPVREKYANRYRYLLVDEYQDTNFAQYLITKYLGDHHKNVCVVGDPDQSIYGWRGANLGNIAMFEQDFPQVTTIRLERNYRSSKNIVHAAGALIRWAQDRPDKDMWTDRPAGVPVLSQTSASDLDEADAVVKIAQDAGAGPRQTAVLYRMNAQSRPIEDALRRANIPYHIVGNIRFYERREIKDTLAYLKAVLNPNDDVSLRRIINVPPRKIGAKTLEKLMAPEDPLEPPDWLFEDGTSEPDPKDSLWSRLVHATDSGRLGGITTSRLHGFRKQMERMREKVKEQNVGTAVMTVVNDSGYVAALRAQNTEEATERIANLMELVSAAQDYEDNADKPLLAEFVDNQSLLSQADEGDGPNDSQVWMMTLHSAKGLEFPTVVIVGFEEGLLPHSRAIHDSDQLNEERRLCYVGMTRAENKLVLSTARTRRRYGTFENTEPSRFLEEIERNDTAA